MEEISKSSIARAGDGFGNIHKDNKWNISVYRWLITESVMYKYLHAITTNSCLMWTKCTYLLPKLKISILHPSKLSVMCSIMKYKWFSPLEFILPTLFT